MRSSILWPEGRETDRTMCARLRLASDMSRVSNRATTIAATIVIVLLVVLLVILWSGANTFSGIENTEKYRKGNNDTTTNAVDPSRENQASNREDPRGSEESAGGSYRNDVTTSSNVRTVIEKNFTNEVLLEQEESSTIDYLPSTKGDLEYVKLLKISQNQYEDPLEEYSTAKRHHSGHFRHTNAEVWDPHPQYEFTAFGRRFRLRLAHDSSFVAPDIKVTHMTENATRREHPGHELGCFYSGSVDGDPMSMISVSLCHGMTGHMKTSTGSYFIKPAGHWHSDKDQLGSSLQHAIYRVSSPATKNFDGIEDSASGRNCGVIDYDTNEAPAPLTDDSSAGKIYVGGRTRERRSLSEKTSLDDSNEENAAEEYEQFVRQTEHQRNFLRNDNRYYSVERRQSYSSEENGQKSEMESDPFVTWRPRRALPREYFIEIMVVADAKMVEYHGNNLVGYILVLMSTVSRIYKDQSIGNPISIAVMNIVKTDEIFGTKYIGSDGIAAAEMLKRFCHWQKLNNPQEPSPNHHDTALLLTRENLCHNPGQKRCDTLGLAELGRMCSPGASCAIVQDNGLAAAFTIAHEIGHVLSMPHDDDSKCSGFGNRSGVHNVMSRMLDDNTFPWEWSKCSRHHVTEFLESGYGNCLLDKPSKTMEKSDLGRLPGEDYSENRQCELVFGPGSRICPHMVSDVCRRLWCTAPMWDHHQQCHTQHMPWADGTPCGAGKWCHRGECVSRRSLRPVDGRWGEWGPYGECSRTCGGGIKKKYRECNDPPPQNGGNYCVGERVKYRSCGTKECPAGSPDFREQQCSKFDNNNLNIQNLARDVKWRAKYTRILPEDRCKLYCQVESNQYYMLRDKVIDGTPCGPDTFHICVNGRCKPAGCDHVLNSTAELDTCGVCRGDNSTCQRITGSYNASVYGYTKVTKIPAGSSYIDIRQHGWMGSHNDSNYLALRLGEDGEYILNGNFMVMHKKVLVHPSVTIEYSGPESVVERLNSSRPISVDLVVEVLSVGNVYPPQITYEYTVPKKILDSYTWVLSDWSICNRMCQGARYRKAECRSTEHKDVVSDDYCRAEEKPREETQICNTHCTLSWQITSMSECSSHCGPGTQTIVSRCIQVLSNSDAPSPRPIPAHACQHLERPNERRPCVGPCDYAHWRYSEWARCSVTCGGGIQSRSATCVDSNEKSLPDENCAGQEKYLKRTCGHESCPKWDLGEWGMCSVTCGKGKRQRPYWCQVDNRVVPYSYCSGVPSGVTETCDAGPCPEWHAGVWSPCSVTCGEGMQRRKVVCKSADGTVNDDCSLSEKPEDSMVCALQPCPTITLPPIVYSPDPPHEEPSQQDNEVDGNRITIRSGYKWRTGPYGECSKSCNGGVKSIIAKCVSVETGIAAPDDYCDANHRPLRTVSCNQHACPIWTTGDWSECNVECGDGTQHRQVRCRSSRGDFLRDSECSIGERPRHARGCRKTPCVGNSKHGTETSIIRRWRVTNWTPCSAKCGKGIQRRTVTCHRVNRYGWVDPTPSEGCPTHQKPVSEQICKLRECTDNFYWSTGPWRKCSHPCGRKGQQTRKLFCHDITGKRTARLKCPIEFKPQRKRKCNQKRCGPMTCLEVQRRFKATTDGEYSLIVGGRNMSVYCYDMGSSLPREYLTLPAGGQENYAEIYNKRLINPHTCPSNGARNDSCHCVTERGTISGKTMFERVRIDTEKLYIVADDYTFSRTTGANRVEFGKAGDCYSAANCPQGRFSINLSGTPLRLSSEVTWVTQSPRGSLAIDRINDQRIVGKCGGYCGFCTPKAGLKLDFVSLRIRGAA